MRSRISATVLATRLVANEDPLVLQLEQSLKANPDNIQVLQRLSTLAKSRGDLLECIAYHKRILKIHPKDVFSHAQLRQLLENAERDTSVFAK